MEQAIPPWRCSAAVRAISDGSRERQRIGKPVERLGRQSQRLRGIRPMLVRLPDTLRPDYAKKGRISWVLSRPLSPYPPTK